jgi:hypothetical protein
VTSQLADSEQVLILMELVIVLPHLTASGV